MVDDRLYLLLCQWESARHEIKSANRNTQIEKVAVEPIRTAQVHEALAFCAGVRNRERSEAQATMVNFDEEE